MTLTEAVRGTYAVIGQTVTDIQLAMIVSDLSEYHPDAVLQALTRCRRELKHMTLADIIDRIPGGHPGAEEAWALIAKSLDDEQVSIAWTDEMALAMGVARGLADDPVAARMAFKESYLKIVNEARMKHKPPRWMPSYGWEKTGREAADMEVTRRNLLVNQMKALPSKEMPVLNGKV